MVQIFGECNNDPLKSQEYLRLRFSPSSAPLQLRWRNNGLSADFLADYLITFFPSDENDPQSCEKEAELKGAVSYIANELLENAMKFNGSTSNIPIKLELMLYSDHLILCVSNHLPSENIAGFQSFIHELLNTEPQDLYVRQIERADQDDNMTTSGLGLLTMIDDYNAKLGWKFESILQEKADNIIQKGFISRFLNKIASLVSSQSQRAKLTVVTTMVQLSI